MSEDLLPRIPGQYIAHALQTLPRAETAADTLMEATVEVPGVGTVRITAKKAKHRKGRSTSYFWTPERAVVAPSGQTT
jgi:hypothetical protein